MPWPEGAASSPPPTWRSPPRAPCSATSEISIGLFPIIVYPTLAKAIGARAAREMALTGRRVDADEACRLGLVHRVVPAADHLEPGEGGRSRVGGVRARTPSPSASGSWAQVDELPRRTGDGLRPVGPWIVHDDAGLRRGPGGVRREAPAALPRPTCCSRPWRLTTATGQPSSCCRNKRSFASRRGGGRANRCERCRGGVAPGWSWEVGPAECPRPESARSSTS